MSSPTLRRLVPSDADDVLAAFDSDPDMARQGDVTDLATARGYIDRLLGTGTQAFAITDDDRLVGLVGISVDTANRVGWFWYWMNRSHRGLGWTSRCATTVANWALGDGALERLELGHRANNPSSGAVAASAGFVLEGRERAKFLVDGERIDVLTYGRLRTDPWPADPAVSLNG